MFGVMETPIDAEAVRRAVRGPANGAVVVFHGTVRDQTADRRVTHLEYEAYVPMAEAAMARIGAEVVERHGLTALACVHRTGRLEVGDDAVVVAASSPHRRAALEAVEDFVRRLKEDVPIWKKENWADGTTEWVHPSDEKKS